MRSIQQNELDSRLASQDKVRQLNVSANKGSEAKNKSHSGLQLNSSLKIGNSSRKEYFTQLNGSKVFNNQRNNYFNSTLEIDDDEEEAVIDLTIKDMIVQYCSHSALFIFHKNSAIRKFCMTLAESAENIKAVKEMEQSGDLENYQQGSDSGVSNAQKDDL